MIGIVWHGHSCFEIYGDNKPRILIDPHDGYSIGLKPPKPGDPDIVLITHNHFDHNYYKPYQGESLIVKWRPGTIREKSVVIEGIEVPHDESRGTQRGMVVAYKIDYGGIVITHLGDIGTEKLGEEALQRLAGSNIVMIPVGGVYTIGAVAANRLLDLLKPNIAIPMHFWVKGMTLPIDPLERFLEYSRFKKYRFDSNRVELDELNIPDPVHLFILKTPS